MQHFGTRVASSKKLKPLPASLATAAPMWLHLRATAELHDFLASNPRGAAAARAFSLLSVSYWRLGDLDLWSLARLYDEACIREAPNTDLAPECLERYTDLVRTDEAGNGGRLSRETEQRLKMFRDLAGDVPRREPRR